MSHIDNTFSLAMTILVRDEVDIIEENIRFHSALGVDRFVVTDNGSIDGTRETVEALSSEFDITLFDEPEQNINQDLWVSRMAMWLKDNNMADWIINNDADEFWIPKPNSLKLAIEQAIHNKGSSEDAIGVIYCQRKNMIPSRESTQSDNYHFSDNTYSVLKNMENVDHQTSWLPANGNIIIRQLPGKVITRSNGLNSIDMGNHGAQHSGKKVVSDSIDILHYPIRSYQQFLKKVVNYGSSLEKNTRFEPGTSSHLRHWYECYKEGNLESQYDLFVLPDTRLQELNALAILKQDTRLQQWHSIIRGNVEQTVRVAS